MKKIVIIGNGISGVTAARHIRKKSKHALTIISSESEHFFSRTALMYVYMGHMRYKDIKPYDDSFWKKNRITLLKDQVIELDAENKTVVLASKHTLQFDILIIATGSQSNGLSIPGAQFHGVQGLYTYQDLQLMEVNTLHIQQAVVVGGGLIGVEMAEMLHSRNIPVTYLIREKAFWGNVLPPQEAQLISQHLKSHGIRLIFETELKEIQGYQGRVTGVVTHTGKEIPCEFVGITIGVSPNIDFLSHSSLEIDQGILVNEFLETNIPDVYAIGDCAQRRHDLPGRKRIEQVWYTGRMMGEVVAQTICRKKTPYQPGPWFNSAKFFDIEYQNYGIVPALITEEYTDFFWTQTNNNKCMHFVWQKADRRFMGINTFGIRLRHECFDNWLRNDVPIEYVIAHLKEANFDPEFSIRYEGEIIASFQKSFPEISLFDTIPS